MIHKVSYTSLIITLEKEFLRQMNSQPQTETQTHPGVKKYTERPS